MLEDFLKHEVGKPAPFDRRQVPLDLIDRLIDVSLGQIADPVAIPLQHHHLAVVEVHHRPGVLQNGGRIRRHEILPVTHPDQQRGPVTSGDQRTRLIGRDHRNAVGALDVPECRSHGFFEIAFVVLADQMGQHLRVGFRLEGVTAHLEGFADRAGVFDDPIVNDGDPAGLVQMGVSVGGRWGAVGGPTGVPDTDRPLGHIGCEGID